ncbi:MAG: hypothetical protein C5B50_14375 [Verrucomicrobia bacterium]|nr:MAG: hypothetical protein C5B50_14375 [Verrucomicrobiota bacterium]
MFESISIKNFRGFGNLALNGLKRVNLIVGKNNAGKTSLLEAVASLADPRVLGRLPILFRATHGGYPRRFYRWLIRDDDGVTLAEVAGHGWGTNYTLLFQHTPNPEFDGPYQKVLEQNGLFGWWGPEKPLRSQVISVRAPDSDQMVKTFAQAVRQRDGEHQIESLLRTVDPRVSKARVDVAEDGNVIVVDLGLSEMIPLAQAGEGMYRLVWIFADLLGEHPQLCFIDEVENGIHHSVLAQVWSGIAEVAQRLDLQVFATTHSDECLRAAHEAFASRPAYDLSVVQLFRVEDGVQGRVLDRKHIEAAIAGDIDLR